MKSGKEIKNERNSNEEITKFSEEIQDEIEKKEIEFINKMKHQFPNDYLLTDCIYIKNYGLIWYALFKCRLCSKPINHHQYAFSGCCGSCDIGNKNPKWTIEMPEFLKKRMLEEIAKDNRITELEEENKKLKEVSR